MQRSEKNITETKGRELCNNLGMTCSGSTNIPICEHNRMVEALEELSIPITYTENLFALPEKTPAIIFSSWIRNGKENDAPECCFFIALFCHQPDREYRKKLLNVMERYHYNTNVIIDNKPVKIGLFTSVFAVVDNLRIRRSMRYVLRRRNKIIPERSAAEWAM